MAENDANGPATPSNQPTPTAPAPKRRRRKWLIIVGALLVLLILLVLLLPTIASTPPVRSIVVGKINDNLNGKVEISNWSIGWTGGVVVNGIRVTDDTGRQILQIEKLATQLSLIDAIRGKYDLGKTSAEGVDFFLHIDKDGHSNFERLAKAAPTKSEKEGGAAKSKSGAEAKLPDVNLDFATDFRGTIEQEGAPTVFIDSGKVTAKIPNINNPIDESVELTCRVGDGKPGKISLAGTVDAIDGNVVHTDKLAADQNVTLATIDLGALTPFLKLAKLPIETRGVADGGLNVKLAGMNDATALGEIKIAGLEVSGDVFKGGDKFVSKSVSIPVNITRKGDGTTTKIHAEKTGIVFDQGSILLNADAPENALADAGRLVPAAIDHAIGKSGAASQPIAIAGSGSANLTADLDLANIASQLRHTLPIPEKNQITQGHLKHTTTITLANDTAKIATTTDLPDVAGTANGKPVTLSPVHIEAGVNAVGGAAPDLRDLKINTTSGFLNVTGGGASLAKLDIKGDLDLAKMQAQAEQFVDLGKMLNGATTQPSAQPLKLTGTGTFAIATDGDLTKSGGTIATSANVDLAGVEISGLKNLAAPIREPMVSLAYKGDVKRGAGEAIALDGIQNASITLLTGQKDAPTVQLIATADVAMTPKFSAPKFELSKLDIDLPKAQDELAPMLAQGSPSVPVNPYVDPAAAAPSSQPSLIAQIAQKIVSVSSGRLTGSAAGSFDGETLTLTKPFVLSIQKITIEKRDGQQMVRVLDGETFDVNIAGIVSNGAETSAKLSQLSVTSSSNIVRVEKSPDKPLEITIAKGGAPSGSGSLHVASDLARAKQVADAFSGSTAAKPDAATALHSGLLDGTLAFARADQPQTTIDANLALTNLTIGDKLNNESLTVKSSATVPDARDSATASLDVTSSFATVSMPPASLVLTKDGKSVGALEMVRKADVTIQVPSVPKLYALMNAFSPPPSAPPQPAAKAATGTPPPAPLPPLEIAAGNAEMKLSIARDDASATTNINLNGLTLANLALKRGTQAYTFDRNVVVKLVAAIGASANQIQKIQVSQLEGDLNVATLSMPQPIVVTNLTGGAAPSANGTVAIAGSLDRLTPLLAVLQGGDPMPYAGDFSATQALKSDGDNITLVGDITTKQFRVLDTQDRTKAILTEPEVAVKNDLAVNTKQQVATIKNLSVDMPSSQAVGLKMVGSVADWSKQRTLNGVKIDLAYDLAKLWPIVHPMLIKPGQDDALKDLKVAGKYTKTFNVSGSYPAFSADGEELQSFDSIQKVRADGELAVDLLDTSGITVGKLVVPLTLVDGKLTTSYPDKHNAPPATFNGGTLDLGAIVADIGQKIPRISIAQKDKVLVKGASINSLLGDTLGKYVNPVFANSERAKGLLDVTVNYLENVAADAKIIKTESSGRAKIMFSLTDMDIANPVGQQMFGGTINKFSSVLGQGGISSDTANTFQGQIKDAVVTLDAGRTTQDITMQLVDPSTAVAKVHGKPAPPPKPMLLSFQGDIRLSDLKQNLNVVLPTELLASMIGQNDIQKALRQAFPSGVPITLKGTTTNSVVDYGDIGKKFIEGQIKAGGGGVLGDLLGGKKENNASGDGGGVGGAAGGIGALGGLIDKATGNDDKNSDKDKPKEKDKSKEKSKESSKSSKEKTPEPTKEKAPEAMTEKAPAPAPPPPPPPPPATQPTAKAALQKESSKDKEKDKDKDKEKDKEKSKDKSKDKDKDKDSDNKKKSGDSSLKNKPATTRSSSDPKNKGS